MFLSWGLVHYCILVFIKFQDFKENIFYIADESNAEPSFQMFLFVMNLLDWIYTKFSIKDIIHYWFINFEIDSYGYCCSIIRNILIYF